MTHLFNLWAVSCNICVISAAVISSRFPVGSSASIIGTSVAKERAIATRCCCPPDNFKMVRFSSLSESPRRFKEEPHQHLSLLPKLHFQSVSYNQSNYNFEI